MINFNNFIYASTLSQDIIKLIETICTYIYARSVTTQGSRRPLIGQKFPGLNLRHKKIFLKRIIFRPGHRLHNNIPGAIQKIFYQHTVFRSCLGQQPRVTSHPVHPITMTRRRPQEPSVTQASVDHYFMFVCAKIHSKKFHVGLKGPSCWLRMTP